MKFLKIFFVTCFFVINSNPVKSVFQINVTNRLSAELQWKSFKFEHKKQYSGSNEEVKHRNNYSNKYRLKSYLRVPIQCIQLFFYFSQNYRQSIFKSNLALIHQHNAEYNEGKQTYYMGVNSFSDLTHEEFMHKYNTYRAPLIRENLNQDNGDNDQFVSSSQNEFEQKCVDVTNK